MYRVHATSAWLSLGCVVAAGALGSSGCSSTVDVVGADTTVIVGRSAQPLGSGALTSVSGTYSTCVGHTDGDSWSVSIGGGALVYAALSVVKNDVACQLTVARFDTAAGSFGGSG
ncbi:MAG TPA: hypothetical protein VLT33_22540, partial [Labilithrix sp.]|nr:hypothetical protein [Labilithrix sp.]